jgi:hypothetical protein
MGPAFQRDNTKVYSIIKQLVLQGPGRSYIMPFDNAADGRRAWLALINHFEGGGCRRCLPYSRAPLLQRREKELQL